MSGPTRAIHSLAAPPRPPAPATVRPSLQRTAAAASSLHESSKPQPTPPDLIPRRAALLALVLVASPARPASAAFSFSIPGPKELLREQKKKSASYLLAPIAASRDTLVKAQALLASPNASAGDAEEVRGRIGAAGRDCVERQRNSIVAFQSRTGVEAFTFSLILRNAASLLADKDPLKVEADTRLGELIQSFTDLGTVVESSNFELPDDRKKMMDGLGSTISAIDKFEQSVKDCLGI
ncbi:hypothetical protein PR202_gb10776 [Eleusine coracana subsp. coracana]|uniref:Uncharacterized protein n=1 Tax=Eleusine coracana subsp. coracana TaxID=191504 RepID=A0AAV5ELC8_ELECO|nr:hypothetical protein QOZ80_3BG0259290 [Eleusine coracana subsp. coracana]GJN23153.1 hypothetical protein PR202_gb10776 [Eleusine coracana subsp. coracana]